MEEAEAVEARSSAVEPQSQRHEVDEKFFDTDPQSTEEEEQVSNKEAFLQRLRRM